MYHRLIILFLLTSFSLKAQKAQLIVGKWKYKDVAEKEKLDSATLKQARLFFGNLELTFEAGAKCYYSSLPGEWSLNKEETRITITITNPNSPASKRSTEWEIKAVNNKELLLNMGKAVIVMQRVIQQPEAAVKKRTEPEPFDVVKFVRNNSIKELLAYAEQCGHTYTSSTKDGKTEYKVAAPFQYGIETIVDAKSEGLVVVYKFKSSEQRREYMTKLKEQEYLTTPTSEMSVSSYKDGVKIWMSVGMLTWIISKAEQ